MKPTDRIGLPDLPICRDNPFAKGVSINQDIVMEDENNGIPVMDKEAREVNGAAMLKQWEESQKNESYITNLTFGGRVQLVHHDSNNKDRYNADLYASHPTLNRQLLALGREEE